MKIQVKIKTNYGRESIYPVCDNAKKFAKLCGTKTLTREAIGHIKSLGYKVEICQPAFSF
jgi:hypothetical protein